MSADRHMLVLAGRDVTDDLVDRLGVDALDAFDDPYEALTAMSQTSWSRVLIAASYADLGGLCRAVRRLQSGAEVTVLCGSGSEPEVRELREQSIGRAPIDDYLIHPLSVNELRSLANSFRSR